MLFHASVAVALFVAILLFSWSFQKVLKIIRTGKKSDLPKEIGVRLKTVVLEVFFHRKLLRQPAAGVIHLLIFWGFIFLSIGTMDWFLYGLFGFKFIDVLDERIASVYIFSQDLFNFLVLGAVVWALYRRIIVKPARMADNSRSSKIDAYVILGMIGGLVVSSLFCHAIAVQNGSESDFTTSQPMASLLGSVIWGADGTPSTWMYDFWWWLHLAIILGFLNFLPYSKHFHVLAALPNVALSKVRPRGELSTPDLTDESITSFGAEKVEDLKWKSIMDSFSCTECGRCNEFCPTTSTGKELRPKTLMIDLRAAASRRQPLVAQVQAGNLAIDQFQEDQKALYEETLVPNVFSEQFVWDCTTCGACVEACPVMIDHVDTIVEMRRALVLNRGANPEEATTVFRNWESNSNPWGFSESSRQEWLIDKGVPIFENGQDFDYLYYIGCAGSFDDRSKKVVDAVVHILQTAGLKFGILGKEEKCNGETARRMGNEYLAQQMMRTNLELLQGRGAKRIITSCPHCFNTLKNEYPSLGGGFETIHHTQLIDQLLKEGKIQVKEGSVDGVTYHDSCYIGRYNGIYDQPRDILKKVASGNLIELRRNKDKGFCCGAGGGRMWMEEKTGSRININRAEEVLESNAKTVGVGCPFCMTMMSDGLKAKDRGDVQVKDVAEIVSEAIR